MPTELTSLHEIELELKQREQEDPLKLVYKAYPKAIETHRSRKPLTLVIGGNRSGKSWTAVAEALYYCTGRRIYAEVPEPAVVWYVMPSLTMFRRSVLPIFKKLAPEREIKRFSKKDNIVYFRNGSELHFLSADMRQRRLQGASIDFAIMDETPDEEVFEELQARVLDRHGRVLMIFAPIDAQTFWVRDKLYIPWNAGDRTDLDVILMPVADRDGHSLVPHFNDDDIRQMERQWPDPAVRAARMYGEFITRAGLVFRSFDHDTHVVAPFEVPSNYARWFVCDPQYHRFAALYFAADDDGHYYITDEFFSQDDTLARRAERMAAIAGPRDRSVPCYVDSANPQDTAELAWHFQRISAPIGAVSLPMRKEIEKMVLRVHALLEPSEDSTYPKIIPGFETIQVHGAPRLMFFDNLHSTWRWDEREMNCSRLLWEVQRLSWGKDGKPDKNSADGADACDALAYGCSILAAGVRQQDASTWLRKLPLADAIIWDAINKMERSQDLRARE